MKPTPKQLRVLWKACELWRDKYRPLCAESLYQTDRCIEAAPELAETVCSIMGYFPEENDE